MPDSEGPFSVLPSSVDLATVEPSIDSNLDARADATHAANDQLQVFLTREPGTVCPVCDYSLRTLTGDSCPECGRRLKLSLVAAEPFRAAWVITLLSFCTGAGLGIFTSIALSFALLNDGFRYMQFRAQEVWFISCAVLYAACIPMAIFTWVQRKRFLGLSHKVPQTTAFVAVIVVPGSILANALWLAAQTIR